MPYKKFEINCDHYISILNFNLVLKLTIDIYKNCNRLINKVTRGYLVTRGNSVNTNYLVVTRGV